VDAVAELEERVGRYDAERYPVQRATALFHLGSLLADGDAARAREALAESVVLFARAGLAIEAAKAQNALGAAHREAGADEAAADCFRDAARAFAGCGARREEAAALFNLGLVTGSRDALEHARALFAAEGARREEAAAAREVGASLLSDGEAEAAIPFLQRARELGDPAAPNALGLARLAAGDAGAAAELFREAAAVHPLSVRPAGYAMAKANLALALEQAADVRRARLAARQALGVATAPPAVREQASAVLGRVGEGRGDLAPVLAEEPPERAATSARDEVTRWADADPAEREAEAVAWAGDDDAAEVLLGAVLELPSAQFEAVLGALVPARPQLERVASRFHAPQELRVRETLARLWSSTTI